MQLSNRLSYRLSYSCLIVVLYPLYDSPAGRGVPLAYVSYRLVPDNPRRGTLNTRFVGRSACSHMRAWANVCTSCCQTSFVTTPNKFQYLNSDRLEGHQAIAPPHPKFQCWGKEGPKRKNKTHTLRASTLKFGVQGRETHTSSGLKIWV